MNIPTNKINSDAMFLMRKLNNAGHEARIAGGAVRDLLLGVSPKDWDIATTATPEQVTAVMKSDHIRVIPTGISHGTVSARRKNTLCEITTLRVDDETDGRHATVSFTDDWELDSNRRDFTINAMFLDAKGHIHDFHNGMEDLKNFKVRFVNDPETRIKEDFLRIMRFFRFSVRLNLLSNKPFVMDADILKVITNNSDGLKQISGERIWDELRKILAEFKKRKLPNAINTTFKNMKNTGVFTAIGFPEDLKTNVGWIMFLDIFVNDVSPEITMLRLFDTDDGMNKWCTLLRHRFNASSKQFKKIKFVIDHNDIVRTKRNALELLAFNDRSLVLEWMLFGFEPFNPEHGVIVDMINNIIIPKFPISGNDLIKLGVDSGPHLGKILSDLKRNWASNEFSINKDDLKKLVSW